MSRNWCFTINNPTSDCLDSIKLCPALKLLLAVMEVGTNGTVHYQGYLELTNSRKMNWLKRLLPTAHLEMRRGKREDAIIYVFKTLELGMTLDPSSPSWKDAESSTSIEEYSATYQLPSVTYAGAGVHWKDVVSLCRKTTVAEKLAAIQTLIQTGVPELEIANEDFELWVKYNRAFVRYALLTSKPRDEKTHVVVIQGPTGTGKSLYCRDNEPNAYWKQRSQWWDGYTNQDAVVLDEFYGWLPFDLLLRLCDRYPLNVEVKGGSINFNSKRIYITTNKKPDEWYHDVYFPAFIRRVDEWKVFTTNSQHTYSNFDEVNFII